MTLKIKWDSVFVLVLVHGLAGWALFHFTWSAFWVFLGLLWLSGGMGITLCYHRLLTHRSFQLWKPLEYLCAFLGCLAWQNGPIKWVAVHRMHHARSDTPTDPHTPTRGFWWAHMGWMYTFDAELDEYERYKDFASDLAKDPIYRFMNAYHGWFQLPLGIILYLWGGIPFVLWGIFFRIVFLWHGTWFVNSAAHTWGYRIWATDDQSTNNWWVALWAFGEGWHNNHHAFARSAAHGLNWWELDVTYLTIRALAATGLASNVYVPPVGQRRRMLLPARRSLAADTPQLLPPQVDRKVEAA